jgi:hypothetical protein
MGAWGVGTFENDTACDFAGEVAKGSSLAKVEAALDRVLKAGDKYLEAPDASEALAAADIVARLSGNFGDRTPYTEELDKWVERIKIAPSSALLDKARRSIERVLAEPSELLELWQESGEFELWKQSVDGVLVRL